MVLITIVTGAYKPTYNWGASHCIIHNHTHTLSISKKTYDLVNNQTTSKYHHYHYHPHHHHYYHFYYFLKVWVKCHLKEVNLRDTISSRWFIWLSSEFLRWLTIFCLFSWGCLLSSRHFIVLWFYLFWGISPHVKTHMQRGTLTDPLGLDIDRSAFQDHIDL